MVRKDIDIFMGVPPYLGVPPYHRNRYRNRYRLSGSSEKRKENICRGLRGLRGWI
jgi:hypothetical protein